MLYGAIGTTRSQAIRHDPIMLNLFLLIELLHPVRQLRQLLATQLGQPLQLFQKGRDCFLFLYLQVFGIIGDHHAGHHRHRQDTEQRHDDRDDPAQHRHWDDIAEADRCRRDKAKVKAVEDPVYLRLNKAQRHAADTQQNQIRDRYFHRARANEQSADPS